MATFFIDTDEGYEAMLTWCRRYRQRHRITQVMMAERMGCSRADVSEFERHVHSPRISTMARYFHALELRHTMDAVKMHPHRDCPLGEAEHAPHYFKQGMCWGWPEHE